jgi:hypothetical protein
VHPNTEADLRWAFVSGITQTNANFWPAWVGSLLRLLGIAAAG